MTMARRETGGRTGGRCAAAGVALAGALALLAGCAGGDHGRGAGLPLHPCHLKGISEAVECGTLEVFENRETREGRRIDLNVAVIPAVTATPEPDPLFILAGGPGQAATEIGPTLLPLFGDVRRRRDIVLVDQRGTGSSNPLDCPDRAGGEERASSAEEMRRLFSLAEEPGRLRECLEHLDADPRLYTTPIAMDDLDDVRRALGYRSINLYGGSYGTRAGLVYMRRHPGAVRSAVLDGAAPPAIKLPLYMARDGERALRLAFGDCEADEECRARYPDLEGTFDAVLARLARGPLRIATRHPLTGDPVELELTRDGFVSQLRGALYDPDIVSLLPLVLRRAAGGDFDPFLAFGVTFAGGVTESLSLGMFLSVVCSEDVPRIGAGERRAALRGTFLGDAMLSRIERSCAVWPVGALPAGYADPVVSDIPTLVLSGAPDPATPPVWGEEVVRHLSRGRHLIAAGAAHNVLARGCAADIVARFIKAGAAEDLDVSCLGESRRPPFFLDASGPRP